MSDTTSPIDAPELHRQFCAATGPHLLNITNHGIHQWDIVPGLPDTGGQNVFVNQLSAALARLGFRVTIVNRGGFPHPVSGAPRRGLSYRDASQRILYLEDSRPRFVRKEEMDPLLPELAGDLRRRLATDVGPAVDLVISHYWDGARLGLLLADQLGRELPHIWIPHSLGTVKQRNMAPETWDELRVEQRIAVERQLVGRLEHVGATSSLIRQALERDYGHRTALELPPCIDPQRYHPHQVPAGDPLWPVLAAASGLEPQEVRRRALVTEVSRTDSTKRKDVLLRAFARARLPRPTLLVLTVDRREQPLAGELLRLVDRLGLSGQVAVLGSVWELLPALYAASAVYCTPSVMEGFGMSAQEAAASAVPVVASHLVPFAVEHLLGPRPEAAHGGVQRGAGAVVVPADDVQGFSRALELLLGDEELRREMGRQAHDITIPAFTWAARTGAFLRQCGVPLPEEGDQ